MKKLFKYLEMKWLRWDLKRRGIDPDKSLARFKKIIARHLGEKE